MWGATRRCNPSLGQHLFQSTPPVWGATHHQGAENHRILISIHAPRVGGDPLIDKYRFSKWIFQSTPPVWGATWAVRTKSMLMALFQSTPPVWGATGGSVAQIGSGAISIHAPRVGGDYKLSAREWENYDFNPRPPCGGRRHQGLRGQNRAAISIHAPRVGGDVGIDKLGAKSVGFQSTPPVWGATCRRSFTQKCRSDFNPRPPCGGRPCHADKCINAKLGFQSTPPVWGATSPRRCRSGSTGYFNPRPPCGGRPIMLIPIQSTSKISIHAPRVGGDTKKTNVHNI